MPSLVSHGARAAVAMSGHVVYCLEGHRLCRSYEKSAQYSAVSSHLGQYLENSGPVCDVRLSRE